MKAMSNEYWFGFLCSIHWTNVEISMKLYFFSVGFSSSSSTFRSHNVLQWVKYFSMNQLMWMSKYCLHCIEQLQTNLSIIYKFIFSFCYFSFFRFTLDHCWSHKSHWHWSHCLVCITYSRTSSTKHFANGLVFFFLSIFRLFHFYVGNHFDHEHKTIHDQENDRKIFFADDHSLWIVEWYRYKINWCFRSFKVFVTKITITFGEYV